MSTPRVARIERTTKESSIVVEINLDGTGVTTIDTGLPFFDHMLTAFGQHGSFDLTVQASGDTDVDAHHTVEDTGIVLGQAFAQALGDKKGIRRFASCQIPMDETLCEAIVDVSGRPYCVINGEPDYMITSVIGGHYATVINHHFFETLAFNAKIALHVRCHYGRHCGLLPKTTRGSRVCPPLKAPSKTGGEVALHTVDLLALHELNNS